MQTPRRHSPPVKVNRDKARYNEHCYKVLFSDTRTFPDWGATVLFYTALHHVEAFLKEEVALGHIRQETFDALEGHQGKNEFISAHYPELFKPYKRLYQVSRLGRYLGKVDPQRVIAARGELQAVKDALTARQSSQPTI